MKAKWSTIDLMSLDVIFSILTHSLAIGMISIKQHKELVCISKIINYSIQDSTLKILITLTVNPNLGMISKPLKL